MRTFISNYGGDLKTLLLRDFVRKGEGDDFLVLINSPKYRDYGMLAIKTNSDEYAKAVEALEEQCSDVMIVGIEDAESGSPYIFACRVEFEGEEYMFPAIFNARLCGPAEDGDYSGLGAKSFHLRLGDEIDPERLCAVRILYTPGKRIEWSKDDLAMVFASL